MDDYPKTLYSELHGGPQDVWNPAQEARARLLGWTLDVPPDAPAAPTPEPPKHKGWPKGKSRKPVAV